MQVSVVQIIVAIGTVFVAGTMALFMNGINSMRTRFCYNSMNPGIQSQCILCNYVQFPQTIYACTGNQIQQTPVFLGRRRRRDAEWPSGWETPAAKPEEKPSSTSSENMDVEFQAKIWELLLKNAAEWATTPKPTEAPTTAAPPPPKTIDWKDIWKAWEAWKPPETTTPAPTTEDPWKTWATPKPPAEKKDPPVIWAWPIKLDGNAKPAPKTKKTEAEWKVSDLWKTPESWKNVDWSKWLKGAWKWTSPEEKWTASASNTDYVTVLPPKQKTTDARKTSQLLSLPSPKALNFERENSTRVFPKRDDLPTIKRPNFNGFNSKDVGVKHIENDTTVFVDSGVSPFEFGDVIEEHIVDILPPEYSDFLEEDENYSII